MLLSTGLSGQGLRPGPSLEASASAGRGLQMGEPSCHRALGSQVLGWTQKGMGASRGCGHEGTPPPLSVARGSTQEGQSLPPDLPPPRRRRC